MYIFAHALQYIIFQSYADDISVTDLVELLGRVEVSSSSIGLSLNEQ